VISQSQHSDIALCVIMDVNISHLWNEGGSGHSLVSGTASLCKAKQIEDRLYEKHGRTK
jgi:hypothetical protein